MARSLQALRFTFRRFRTDPAFSLGMLLTLVLSFGISTASFSVGYGVLLKPLPYPGSEDLFLLWETKPVAGWAEAPACPSSFLAWQAAREVFQEVTAYSVLPLDSTLTGQGPPRSVRALPVYGNFFAVLGVAPARGGGLSEADSWAGAEPAVVFSHRLWSRLGADPGIVGKVIRLDDVGHRVAGVMPEGFGFPFPDLDAWVPIVWHESSRDSRMFRIAHNLRPVARLKTGVSPEQARSRLATISARLELEHPDTNAGKTAGMSPLREWIAGDFRTPLLILFGAATFVLLIALANATNLQLVHISARSRELAVRSALGASRRTLLGQLLAEALVLSLIGGIVGTWLGAWGARLLLSTSSEIVPRAEEVGLDAAVLGFGLVVATLAGLGLGLVSAVHALRAGRDPLQEGSWRSRFSPAGRGFRKLLMASEVALAVLLAVGAGLLFFSFQALRGVDPGFQPRGLLAVGISLPRSQYPEDSQKSAFFRRVLERLRSIPGVEAAALVDGLPLSGLQWIGSFSVEGRPPTEESEFHHRVVSPGYFQLLGVPLLRGRGSSGAPALPALGGEDPRTGRFVSAEAPFRGLGP
jgi:putative ABC transport system permease protein